MNQNVIHNATYNYLSSYKLSMEHFEEMKKLIVKSAKTKFYLYKRLCKWPLNSRVTKGKSSFVVEIDAEENRGLVKDLKKNFLINVIKRTRVQNKKGHHRE